MYYACLDALTPPVCVAVFMAPAWPNQTGLKPGVFLLVRSPDLCHPLHLLLQSGPVAGGERQSNHHRRHHGALGVVFIDICTVGYLRDKVNMAARLMLLGGGILLLLPQYLPSLIGFVVGSLAVFFALKKRRPTVNQ